MEKKKRIHVWPLAIAIVYGLFMVYLAGLFAFSRMNKPELVSESYYEDELKYQQQIDRMTRTRTEGATPSLRFREASQTMVLEFPAVFAQNETRGKIVFFRPSDADQDMEVALNLDGQGRQEVDVHSLSRGLWKVKIQWQTSGKEYYHEEIVILP